MKNAATPSTTRSAEKSYGANGAAREAVGLGASWGWARFADPSFRSFFWLPGVRALCRSRRNFAKIREREIRNVRGDLGDPLRSQFQFGPELGDHVARMRVVNHLRDDAVRRKAGPCRARPARSSMAADQLAEAIVNGPHGLIDHARHGGRGLREFVHHQPEMPSGTIGPADSLQHGVDQFAKSLFGRSRAVERLLDDSVFRSADRMPEDFGVELQLVAEMIIDQRDVDAGAGADFADGRGLETGFGKDLAGGIEQFVARVIWRPRSTSPPAFYVSIG